MPVSAIRLIRRRRRTPLAVLAAIGWARHCSWVRTRRRPHRPDPTRSRPPPTSPPDPAGRRPLLRPVRARAGGLGPDHRRCPGARRTGRQGRRIREAVDFLAPTARTPPERTSSRGRASARSSSTVARSGSWHCSRRSPDATRTSSPATTSSRSWPRPPAPAPRRSASPPAPRRATTRAAPRSSSRPSASSARSAAVPGTPPWRRRPRTCSASRAPMGAGRASSGPGEPPPTSTAPPSPSWPSPSCPGMPRRPRRHGGSPGWRAPSSPTAPSPGSRRPAASPLTAPTPRRSPCRRCGSRRGTTRPRSPRR